MNPYRVLRRAYPRDFRNAYGDDMARLFAEQRRDERGVRVWARALLDLAVTIPTQHLEARMYRPPKIAVAYAYAVLSAVVSIVTSQAARDLRVFFVGIAIAVVFAGLAVSAWLRTQPVAPASAETLWWRVLLSGAGLIAAIAVGTSITGELPSGWWLPTMMTLLAGFLLTVLGVVLGVTRLVTHR